MPDEEFIRQPDGRDVAGPELNLGTPDKPGLGLLVTGLGVAAVLLVATILLIRGGEGGELQPGEPGPVESASPSLLLPSRGITQAQLDRLGDSIQARYRAGDTEVAQALLDNFMDAHPECVSAVMAGGVGRMRDVLAESEEVASYLKSTAPYPNAYTTVITNRVDGEIKGAVLGVSCKEGGSE